MTRRLLVYTLASLGVVMCSSPKALTTNEEYGYLDFTRLNQKEEQQFFKRLRILAFEEAFLMRCGQPDNFASRAREAMRACVTREALDRAEKYFVDAVGSWSDIYEKNKQSCMSVKVTARPSLGVHIKITPAGANASDLHGALVEDVMPFSSASAAGMKSGDLIIRLNETAISNYTDLIDELARRGSASTAEVEIERNGIRSILNVQLTTMTYRADGQLATDGGKLLTDSRDDLNNVVAEVTKLCNYCKYSIFRAFCR